jgi:hypothetical protein
LTHRSLNIVETLDSNDEFKLFTIASSIAEYIVQNPDSNDEFKSSMSLGSGSTIAVAKANLEFFLDLSREFGNSSLCVSLIEHFNSDFIRSQLLDSASLDLFSEDMIRCFSSRFPGLTWSELEVIRLSILFDILSHHLLKISS